MATVVAIEVDGTEALLVAAERGEGNTINLLGVHRVPLDLPTQIPVNGADTPAADDAAAAETPWKTNGSGDLSSLIGFEVDSAMAVIDPSRVLHRLIELPFNNSKKVEQTAPLQIQDEVPFDIEGFVVDNLVLSKNDSGQYGVLTSIAPEGDVASSLAALTSLGIDPKIVTTRTSAVSALHHLLDQPPEESYGLLEFNDRGATLALFFHGELRQLRNFTAPNRASYPSPRSELAGDELRDLLIHVECSIRRAELDHDTRLARLFVIGSYSQLELCRSRLETRVLPFDFNAAVRNHSSSDLDAQNLSWAIGLFAAEFKPSAAARTNRLIDFRKGPFAYRKAWKELAAALHGEMFFIIFAIAFGIGWCVSLIYDAESHLAKIEDKFLEIGRTVLPGERIPARGEVSFLDGQLGSLEEQLGDIGSLSSLSPLETLNQLSIAIDPDIDIEIDSLVIGQSRVTLRGSVANHTAAGRLETALKKRAEHFCSVDVSTKGMLPGSSRVNLITEIELCK